MQEGRSVEAFVVEWQVESIGYVELYFSSDTKPTVESVADIHILAGNVDTRDDTVVTRVQVPRGAP
jgi:hypothetical protein